MKEKLKVPKIAFLTIKTHLKEVKQSLYKKKLNNKNITTKK